jgi:asparagine synthase (glutamine-hydrolysing)
MSGLVSEPIKTFSVGFDYQHDELQDAAFTAGTLGCDHHEIACRAEDVMLLPEIVYQMDEPMGDPITIPMYMLSRAAKEKVTVILTGEGGDEVFGGYLFHKVMWAGDVYRRYIPRTIRDRIILPLMAASPASVMNLAFQYPAYLGERGKQKAIDYMNLLEPEQIDDAYRHLISLFDSRDTRGLYTPEFLHQLNKTPPPPDNVDFRANGSYLNRLIHLQFDHWLPDNMLLRQDKTGMAHAIEGRVPYLDHSLVEFAMRLPPHLKLRRLTGKYILRRFAKNILPAEVTQRKKMPFYVPIENYFKQPDFQALMNELLSEESVRSRGIFQPEAVGSLRDSMQKREFLFVKQVFSLMVLELWFRTFHNQSHTI